MFRHSGVGMRQRPVDVSGTRDGVPDAAVGVPSSDRTGVVVGSVVGRAVLAHVESGVGVRSVGRSQEAAVSAGEAYGELCDLVRVMWAKTTSAQRQGLWCRMVRWLQHNRLPLSADTAVLFVMATRVSTQAKLTYVKGFQGTIGHMGVPCDSLRSAASVLRAAGGAVPSRQASPIAMQLLVDWGRRQSVDVHLAVLLAWKTASRWGEVVHLSHDQFLVCERDEVVIDWHQTPKGRRRNPFTTSKWTVIRGDLVAEIAGLVRRLRPFTRLCSVDTQALVRRWSKDASMHQYTGHSIKRGALTHLFQAMAQGVVVPEHLVARLAKHKSSQGLPEMTVRYGADPVAVARALGTGDVTVHL